MDLSLGAKISFNITTDRQPAQVATRIAGLERAIRIAIRDYLSDPGHSTGGDWNFKLRISNTDDQAANVASRLESADKLGWNTPANVDDA